MQPTPSAPERLEEVGLDPAVEHRVRGLVNQQRRPQAAEDRRGFARPLGRVGGDAHVERLSLADGGVERAHRLLERGLGVESVRVEDVDVVEPHPPQAGVEAREQVLARSPLAVGPRPHVVAGLGRDDELVAIGARDRARRIRPKFSSAEPYGRAVVVGEVEVRDPEVERAAAGSALAASSGTSWPKLCQRPSETAGSLSPLRPQRRYSMRS